MSSVLIIDDEPAITSALAQYFERTGHEVHRAHSGEEGIGAVRRTHPDLVLLDLRLPDLNGFEVLDRIREHNSVVIMITGHGDLPDAVRAMQAGAESFLTKPVELAHLGAVATRALEKARLRQMNRYLADRRGRLPATPLLDVSLTYVGALKAFMQMGRDPDYQAEAARMTMPVGAPIGGDKLAAMVNELAATTSADVIAAYRRLTEGN